MQAAATGNNCTKVRKIHKQIANKTQMTVAELMKQLQTYPPDMLVVTDGYEEGYDTIKRVTKMQIAENPQKEWYVGKYIESSDTGAVEAVFLNAETKAEDK